MPPVLLAAIAKQESGFNPAAGSPAGAQGLFQLMPDTARGLGVSDPHDPAQSAMGGAKYMAQMLAGQKGDVRLALAAYNAGPARVNGAVPRIPETQAYVKTIMADAGVQAVTTNGRLGCDPAARQGQPVAPVQASGNVKVAYDWAMSKVGLRYVMGANGPDAYDCSSFALAALSQAGVKGMPRTAHAQRQWCAEGNCTRIQAGQEKTMDLMFWKSYLGTGTNDPFGHVAFVNNPQQKSTIDARGSKYGVGVFKYGSNPTTEYWRPKAFGQ